MPRRSLSGLAMILCVAAGWADDSTAGGPEDSVVRVSASIRYPNPARPWSRQNPVEHTGSGTVIDGKTILTSAHIVLYASEVFVQDRQGGDRYEAKVATIGPGIDLATLTLEDETFFEKHPPLARAPKRPNANSPVDVLGFPVGGVGLAVTKGTISRIDYATYGDYTEGLRIQLDAAINPGNSGGPALVNGRMVGLIFGQLGRAENVGYVIPNEEVDTYLQDVKDGRYDGKYRVEDRFQVLENDSLRAKLGLSRTDRGIMVRKPHKADPSYPIRENDVLVKIGDEPVDNEGMVAYEEGLRLPFTSLIPRLAQDGKIAVKLIREGKPIDAFLPVTRDDDRLIKPYSGQYPTYFVHGPLVFSPAILEAIQIYARGNPLAFIGSPLTSRENDMVGFPGEELVIVTAPLLPHRLTRGYAEPLGQVVRDVDGVPVKNLRHLVELFRDGQGEFLTIRFHGDQSEVLVFRRKALEDSTAKLMVEHGIPSRGSEELMAVWKEKPAPVK